MSGQILRQFAFPAGNKAKIILAQTVVHQGFHCVVDAIAPDVKEEAAKLTEVAMRNVVVVPAYIQERTAQVVLRLVMFHQPSFTMVLMLN